MTLDELKRLDPKKIGSWPVLPKLGVLFGLLLLMLGLSYYFVWADQLAQIESEEAKTEQLKNTFIEKKKVAVNLPAYRKQLDDIEKQFGALLKQLPGKSEMDALLTTTGLAMDATAMTYRYLDEAEVAEKRRAAAATSAKKAQPPAPAKK